MVYVFRKTTANDIKSNIDRQAPDIYRIDMNNVSQRWVQALAAGGIALAGASVTEKPMQNTAFVIRKRSEKYEYYRMTWLGAATQTDQQSSRQARC